jgi:hypothetical protein
MKVPHCTRCGHPLRDCQPLDTLCAVCRDTPAPHSTQAMGRDTVRHGIMSSDGIDYGAQAPDRKERT